MVLSRMNKLHIPFLITFILLFLSSGCSSMSAETENNVKVDEIEMEKMQKLNTLADEIYLKTNEGNIEEARSGLIQLSQDVTRIRFIGMTSVEGIEALTETIVSAKNVFNAVSFSMDQGIIAVTKVRLATDALTHPKHPMWLGYYKILQEDGEKLNEALQKNDQAQIHDHLEQIFRHYSIIRPAVIVNREPSEVNKMDSFLQHLNSAAMNSAINQYELILAELFHRKADTAYLQIDSQSNPMFWIVGLGSIIVAVLTYVGWRKYQYERNLVDMEKQRRRERDY